MLNVSKEGRIVSSRFFRYYLEERRKHSSANRIHFNELRQCILWQKIIWQSKKKLWEVSYWLNLDHLSLSSMQIKVETLCKSESAWPILLIVKNVFESMINLLNTMMKQFKFLEGLMGMIITKTPLWLLVTWV